MLLDKIHGDYPFVTSSHPTVGGLMVGTGFRPKKLEVWGVVKAYCTRVGNGTFPTENKGVVGKQLRKVGKELGTTTGRPRRCGWLDLVILKYAIRVNGLDYLAMTKLDVLSGIKMLKVCVGYKVGSKLISDYPADIRVLDRCRPVYKEFKGWSKDITGVRRFASLPSAAQRYVKFIEKFGGVRIKLIGVGPGRQEVVKR